MNWIIDKLCNLTASDWAAWVQAFGVFIAIFFSSRIALKQSHIQYSNSLRLQKIQDLEKKLILTEAVVQIFRNASLRIKNIEVELKNREAIDAVSTKLKYFDFDCLKDILEALKQIPLHDLPSAKLVNEVMIAIATIRQLDIQLDKAFNEARYMTAQEFDKVLLVIKEISIATEKIHLSTEESKKQLQIDLVNLS